jgi:hypothetical protein
MRWDDVIRAMSQAALHDLVLASIYGDAVRAAGYIEHLAPSLQYRLVSDTEAEQWAPHIVQWDQWTLTPKDLEDSERALRLLFNQDDEMWFGDVRMWSVYLDGAELIDANPDRFNFYGRTVRFRLTPVRDRYVMLIDDVVGS